MKKHIYVLAFLFFYDLSFSLACASPPSADKEEAEACFQSKAKATEILLDIGKACSSEKGAAIAEQFYANLFKGQPEEFKGKFNHASQHSGLQAGKLSSALGRSFETFYKEKSYQSLTPLLELISSRHARLNVQPEDYSVIGNAFIQTLEELKVLKTDKDKEVVLHAYKQLSQSLQNLEKQIYDKAEKTEHSWKGEKSLILSHKEIIGDSVTWVLKEVDGTPLPVPPPGSSITLIDNVESSGRTILQMRPYTPYIRDNDLRITVKKTGLFSKHLFKANEGTTIKAFSPVGTYEDQFPNPASGEAILLTAGSGITEAFSIIPSLEKQGIKTFFIHTTQNQGNDLSQKIERTELLSKHVFYTQSAPTNDSSENISFGRINEDKLKNILQDIHWKESRFFICGPTEFNRAIKDSLRKLNPRAQIITQGR